MCTGSTHQGDEEWVFEAEGRSHGENRVQAAEQSSKQDQFTNVRFHRKTGQVEPQSCQVLWMVQSILTTQH